MHENETELNVTVFHGEKRKMFSLTQSYYLDEVDTTGALRVL